MSVAADDGPGLQLGGWPHAARTSALAPYSPPRLNSLAGPGGTAHAYALPWSRWRSSRARGLVKTFGEGRAARRVLDGADLDVEAGEIVAVLGRSGSGKSTLLHVLGGLDRPEAGTIEVARRARRPAPASGGCRRCGARHIGFVFQFFHLLPELSGEANVLLAARVRGARAGGARARPRAGRPARPARGRGLAAARSSPAASSSASRSPARSSTTRRCCWPTSRPATSTPRPAPTCCELLRELGRRGPRRGARHARGRARRRSPTACCGSSDGRLVGRRDPRPRLARGCSAISRRGARGRDRGDRRLRARDRLRPRRGAGGPARRDRPLRRARPRGPSTSASARCPTWRRAPTARGEERRPARATAHGDAQGRPAHRARRPARLRGGRGPRRCAAADEVVVERGLAREWDLAPATGCRSAVAGSAARSSAWRSSPTTSRSRSRSRRASTSSELDVPGRARAANLALLWLADPGARRHHARAGARDVVRDRRALRS